jgi:hypothetical protein
LPHKVSSSSLEVFLTYMAVLLYARDERRLEAVDMYPLRYEDHNLSISTRSKKKEEEAVEWLDSRAVLHSLLTAGRRR